MEKDITDIFLDKEFHELNASEKEQIRDLCENEEDFEQMRFLFTEMAKMKSQQERPGEEVKRSLDNLFAEVNGSKKRVLWYNSVLTVMFPRDKALHRRPFVQIAAILAIIVLSVPFFRNEELVKMYTIQVAQEKAQEIKVEKPAQDVVEQEVKNELSDDRVENTAETAFTRREMSNSNLNDFSDMLSEDEVSTAMRVDAVSTAGMTFVHPDGIYMGEATVFSVSTAQVPEMLDLITAVF